MKKKNETHNFERHVLVPKSDYQSLLQSACECVPPKKGRRSTKKVGRSRSKPPKPSASVMAALKERLKVPAEAYAWPALATSQSKGSSKRASHKKTKKVKKRHLPKLLGTDVEMTDLSHIAPPASRGRKRKTVAVLPPPPPKRTRILSVPARKRRASSPPMPRDEYLRVAAGWKKLREMPMRASTKRPRESDDEDYAESNSIMFKRAK